MGHWKHSVGFCFALATVMSMAGTFVAAAGTITPAAAQKISIHPKRVVLEGRERSTTIELINRGEETVTYRLGFQRMRATEEGGRELVEQALPGERFSDEYIRFSPRQVTLRPGETQRVRLMARKPADLEAGEYRSHLQFQALPTVQRQRGDEAGSGLSVSLQMRTNMSIPVIVREGELEAQVEFSSVELVEEAEPMLAFTLKRQGQRSVYGDFQVSFVSADTDEETFVALRRGVAVYSPNGHRNFRLPLQLPDHLSSEDGELRIRFSEAGPKGVQAEWRGELNLESDGN